MSSRANPKRPPPGENAVFRRRDISLNGPSPERPPKRSAEGDLPAPRLRSSDKGKGGSQLNPEASGGSSKKNEGSPAVHGSAENHDSPPTTGDKPRKVKLKIGGIRSAASEKAKPDVPDSRPSAAKPPLPPGDSRHKLKHGSLAEGAKDSGKLLSSQEKKTKKVKAFEETSALEQQDKVQREPSSDLVRKSRRLAKKPITDRELDADYDTGILESHETSEDTEDRIRDPKSKRGSSSKKKATKKGKSRNTVYEVDSDFVATRSNGDAKRRSRESTDGDKIKVEPESDSELEAKNKKQKVSVESPANVKIEPLTTRRRALQSWMDGNSSRTVEFPEGLRPSSSRSKKEKLSEAELLAKKAEAAQRRKMQIEKAAKESEAEAIRKILGLDTEKKKEEKKQKEREEKEKAAKAQELSGSTIRWVMGPTGTVVSFPDELGLPSIFNSKPSCYPPPREKCAGPSCTNAYRYRDSKLKLPLCSLKCYRAVHGSA